MDKLQQSFKNGIFQLSKCISQLNEQNVPEISKQEIFIEGEIIEPQKQQSQLIGDLLRQMDQTTKLLTEISEQITLRTDTVDEMASYALKVTQQVQKIQEQFGNGDLPIESLQLTDQIQTIANLIENHLQKQIQYLNSQEPALHLLRTGVNNLSNCQYLMDSNLQPINILPAPIPIQQNKKQQDADWQNLLKKNKVKVKKIDYFHDM